MGQLNEWSGQYMDGFDKIGKKWGDFSIKEGRKIKSELNESNIDDFLNVSFNGYTFSIVPFLINGCTFIHESSLAKTLYGVVLDIATSTECMLSYETSDIKAILGDDLYYTSKSLLKSYQSCCKELACIAYKDKIKFASMFYQLYVKECFLMPNGLLACDYKGYVTNTQAFSYYIGVWWVLQKSAGLKTVFSQYSNKINLKGVLESAVPSNSIYRKWFNHEIDGKQLFAEYLSKETCEFTYFEKEILAGNGILLTDEKISSLSDEIKSVFHSSCKDISILALRFDPLKFQQLWAYSHFSSGDYTKRTKELESITTRCSEIQNSYARKSSQVSIQLKDNKKLTKDIEKAKKDLLLAQSQVASLKSDSTINDLSLRIKDLEYELLKLSSKVDEKECERLSLVRERCILKKEVKHLKSRLVAFDDIECKSIVEQFDNEFELSDDEINNFLHDKSLIIAGGRDNMHTIDEFTSRGICKTKQFIDRVDKDLGHYDCLIILASYVPHSVSCGLKDKAKLDNKPLLFFNGSNMDLLCRELYFKLKKEDICNE